MNLPEKMLYIPIKEIIKPHNISSSENHDLKLSEEKDLELAIIQSKQQELLEIEKDKEEEIIQLSLYKSLEEMNQKKGENKPNENIINIKEEKNNEEEEDETFGICPITQEYMKHPVLTPSGNYYEKRAIIKWIKEHHTDPMTREKLTVEMLIEDKEYARKIKEYKKKFRKQIRKLKN